MAQLIELHLRFFGYGDGDWTDSAVRRYVRDAGDQLERLHMLTRADVHDAQPAQGRPARLRLRRPRGAHRELQEKEELDAVRPDLDGEQIMRILG